MNEKCETIPDPVQLEYHLPHNFNISVDKNYEQFISKLSASFPKEKKVSRNSMILVQVYLNV